MKRLTTNNTKLLLYAVIIMLLCAGSSPFIRYLSPDGSIFYTMGRSAANGKILYKEIADHKGFYLFALNWLAAWMTPRNMGGLFVIECLFAWMKLVAVSNIARIYGLSSRRQMICGISFLMISTNHLSWNTGNLSEQFALAFQLISMYYMAIYLENCREHQQIEKHDPRHMFIHGLASGTVLFIQANLIAMWIPFGICLGILLIRKKYYRNFFENLISLAGGVAVATLPVALYGIIHNCIKEMYYIMFEVNVLYSADGRIGKSLLGYVRDLIISPSGLILLLALAGVIVAASYYKTIYVSVALSSMLLFSVICMSVSLNANPIYYTVYMPFCIPAIISIVSRINEKNLASFGFICFAFTVILNFQLIKKVLRLGTSSYVCESASIMNELIPDKDEKVLVLGNSIYYNLTGTLPHIRYFTIFGSGLRYETFPYCIDEQMQSLESLENEYVIVEYKTNDVFWNDSSRDEITSEVLRDNYEQILDYREGGIHTSLYQLRTN